MNNPKHKRFRKLLLLSEKRLRNQSYNWALRYALKAIEINPNSVRAANLIEKIKFSMRATQNAA